MFDIDDVDEAKRMLPIYKRAVDLLETVSGKKTEQAEQEPVHWVVPDFGFLFPSEDAAQRYLINIESDARPTPCYAAPVRTKDPTDVEDLQDAMTKALKKAFQLGQTYFQQADSESYAANKRADITLEFYRKLEDDTRAVIAAYKEKNNVWH